MYSEYYSTTTKPKKKLSTRLSRSMMHGAFVKLTKTTCLLRPDMRSSCMEVRLADVMDHNMTSLRAERGGDLACMFHTT